MESRTIYTKEEKVQELCERLPEIAYELTNVLQGIKKHMPEVVFSPFIAYYIVNGYGQNLSLNIEEAVRKNAAKQLLMNIQNESDANFVNLYCRRETQLLRNLVYFDRSDWRIIENAGKTDPIKIYIRTGAIIIGEDGRAVVAPDYQQRLTDYCSVTIESKAEKEAYKQILAMQEAARNITEARKKLASVMPKEGVADEILGRDYTEKRVLIYGGARVSSESSAHRFLVDKLLQYRTTDKPRYYNSIGVPAYDAAALYKYFGIRKKANSGLRYMYPDLYKGVPFAQEKKALPSRFHDDELGIIYNHQLIDYNAYLGRVEENPLIEDSELAFECLKELMKKYKKNGVKFHLDPHSGHIIND